MTSFSRNILKILVAVAACFFVYFLITSPFTTASRMELQSYGDPFAHSIRELFRWSLAPKNSFQPPACYPEAKYLCQWSFFLLPFVIFIPALLFLLQEFVSKYKKSVTVISCVLGALFLVANLFLFEEILTSSVSIGIGHSDSYYTEPLTIVSLRLFLWFVLGVLLIIRQLVGFKTALGNTKNRVK